MGASMGLQPIHSQLMGKREFSKLKTLLFYSIKKTICIGFLVYIVSIPISGFVLKLFGDSPIALQHAKFFYLTIGFAVMFSNLPLQTSSFFTAINRPIESVVISLARTLFLIPIIAYISIMLVGGLGVAVGYLLSDVILIIVLVVYMKKIDISKLKVYD
jgi:Na+-driven multidrug efflux pump